MQARIATVASGGLKTAVVGGAIGMVVGVVGALAKAEPAAASASLTQSGGMVPGEPLAHLTANVELNEACTTLSGFRHHSPASFREVCLSLDKFCEISAKMQTSSPEETRMAWPITAKRHARRALEGVRVMRKKLEEKQKPALLLDFDETQKLIEEELGNLQYNLTMEGASRSAVG